MVEYVVAHCTLIPVRSAPSEESEQLTQLLLGEVCEVLDRLPRWTKIRSTVDGQEGWVDFKMVTSIAEEVLRREDAAVVCAPLAAATPMDGGADLLLTLGTALPNYAHGTFEVLGQQYLIDPSCVNKIDESKPLDDTAREYLVSLALSLLNAPYLWGGKNAMGMDCSGLTQVVYRVLGIRLLRNAREQITQGEVVACLADAQPGDLVFFDHTDRDPSATNISHVGLLLDNKKIIHCSGCVHVDDIDEMGIHLPDGELTHHLVQIKRYF